MIDRDLASLYGVETKNLNKAVKRNMDRFPEDFMFRLTKEESDSLRFQCGTLEQGALKSQLVTSSEGILRSQFATLKQGKGRHRKYLPYVFTEQGVAMLSSVLNSKQAIQVDILIMRTFTKLRGMISGHKELAYKMKELERKVGRHDEDINVIIDVIKKLMRELKRSKKDIGFHVK